MCKHLDRQLTLLPAWQMQNLRNRSQVEFSIKGQRILGKPTKSGVYINGGIFEYIHS